MTEHSYHGIRAFGGSYVLSGNRTVTALTLVYMLTAMLICNGVLTGTLLAVLLRFLHQRDQIRELTDLVGDHVADQFLLNEARQELAETKMQLELSRAGK